MVGAIVGDACDVGFVVVEVVVEVTLATAPEWYALMQSWVDESLGRLPGKPDEVKKMMREGHVLMRVRAGINVSGDVVN